jgi:hypothetical protein
VVVFTRRSLLPFQQLLQAHEAARTDDDVVDQFNVEDFARLDQLPRGVDVILGGCWIAAWVVVADDDTGAVVRDGGAKYLGGAEDGAVDGPPMTVNRGFWPFSSSVPSDTTRF